MGYNCPMKFLKSRNLELVLVGILSLVIALGRPLPFGTDYKKQEGRFTVRTYKYGVFINQPPSRIFYNFSPYDAFYLDHNGNKQRFAYWDNVITSKENSYKDGIITPQIVSLLSSFNLLQPKATFASEAGKTVIKTKTEDNQIRAYVAENPYVNNSQESVITLSYNPTDILIDGNLNLIDTSIGKELLTDIEKGFDIDITPIYNRYKNLDFTTIIGDEVSPEEALGSILPESTESTTSAPFSQKPDNINVGSELENTQKILIFNPNTTGVMAINLAKNGPISINTENLNIEFHPVESSQDKNHPVAVIDLYDNFQEALR